MVYRYLIMVLNRVMVVNKFILEPIDSNISLAKLLNCDESVRLQVRDELMAG